MLLETAQPIGSTTALGMLGRQTARDVRPHGRRITPCRARLLDQVRQAIRVRHYSYRTEQLGWSGGLGVRCYAARPHFFIVTKKPPPNEDAGFGRRPHPLPLVEHRPERGLR